MPKRSHLVVAVVAGLVIGTVAFQVVERWPDPPGDWSVAVTEEPFPFDGWVEVRRGRAPIAEFDSTFADWEPAENDRFTLVRAAVDEFDGVREARARAKPADKLPAPNFQIDGLGDPRRIPVPGIDGFVACGNSTPDACTWWYFFAYYGRFAVTVIYQNETDQPLTSGEFTNLAQRLYVAVPESPDN